VQIRRAIAAQPNHHPRRVYPEKGGHFSGHPHCFSALQTLQCLYKKHPVVDVSVGSTISMYAFSFKHKLLLHGGPSPRAAPRELRLSRSKMDPLRRVLIVLEELQGRANQENFKLSDASGA
jgi:hypothetical protein